MAGKQVCLSKREAGIALGIIVVNRMDYSICTPGQHRQNCRPKPKDAVCHLCQKLYSFLYETPGAK